MDKNHKFKIAVIKDKVHSTAAQNGLSVEEFIRRCASKAGNNLKKAKRMAERFVNGGDVPDCVAQHLNFG